MASPVVVILAAGQGTRMRSATPKLLHALCGRPMIALAGGGGARRPAPRRSWSSTTRAAARGVLDGDVTVAIQREPRGTADAVKAAAEAHRCRATR